MRQTTNNIARCVLMLFVLALAPRLSGGVVAAENETKTVTLNGDGTNTNPYKIGNYAQLVKFANIVNGEKGETKKSNAYAELTADIVANEDLLNADGTLNNNNPENVWTPIGINNKYSGLFDGKGHTISGLYFNDTNTERAGLFGNVTGCIIRNVGIIDSYFNAGKYVGGVCGYSNGKIDNCYNTSTVIGNENALGIGGVCGYNAYEIFNCSLVSTKNEKKSL